MRFWCHDSKEVRDGRRSRWHRWFAWHPVWITCCGVSCCYWLQYLKRKGTFHLGWGDNYWTYEYASRK